MNLTKITNTFRSITVLYSDLTLFPTEPRTNARNTQILTASLNFIQYLHKKSLCKELVSIPPLQIYEMDILTIIGSGKLFMDDTGLHSLSNSVKHIQIILLGMIPVESEEYQKLLKDIPNIAKYTPQIGPQFQM